MYLIYAWQLGCGNPALYRLIIHFNRISILLFQFELVEIRVISIFFEFGGGCIHYNFTAKQPGDHHSADAGSTKLFFSEVNYWFHNENDVLLCCIVGENDAGMHLVTWVHPFLLFCWQFLLFFFLNIFPCCIANLLSFWRYMSHCQSHVKSYLP